MGGIQAARRECHLLTDAITLIRSDAPAYLFSSEHDLIYRLVLGQSAKQIKVARSIPDSAGSIRPYLLEQEIIEVEALQRIDTGLIIAGMAFNERKNKLHEMLQKIRSRKGCMT